ncbi:MAG: hypothetical protein NZ531_02870, partial [Aquificaceae bacterium]|nr:hypothetical protein [Aquificaceae bacterium]
RTTLVLPYDLWEELKIESIKKNKTMSQIVVQKLYLLKALESKAGITQDPSSFQEAKPYSVVKMTRGVSP